MAKQKSTKISHQKHAKVSVQPNVSSSGEKMIWIFDQIDRDGLFCFSLSRDDMSPALILEKIIEYSQLTWNELAKQTHDRKGKSCHHLLDYHTLSKEARDRIDKLQLTQKTECVFSLRLNNMIRIIGIRDEEKFIVKWYDPQHQFCPSTK